MCSWRQLCSSWTNLFFGGQVTCSNSPVIKRKDPWSFTVLDFICWRGFPIWHVYIMFFHRGVKRNYQPLHLCRMSLRLLKKQVEGSSGVVRSTSPSGYGWYMVIFGITFKNDYRLGYDTSITSAWVWIGKDGWWHDASNCNEWDPSTKIISWLYY